MAVKREPIILKKVGSNLDYELRLGYDGQVYCTCPSWRFSKKIPKSCKHLDEFLTSSLGTAFAVTDDYGKAVKAVKRLAKSKIDADIKVSGLWYILFSDSPEHARVILGSAKITNPIRR